MNKKFGYIKKTKINNQGILQSDIRLRWHCLFALFIYPLFLIFFIETAAKNNFISAIFFIIFEPFYFFLNYFIYVLILFFAWSIFYNKWLSFNIINIIFYFIALLNFIKIKILKSGFTLYEINIFKEKNLFKYINLNIILPFIFSMILGLVVLNIILYFIYEFNINNKIRIIVGLFSFVLLILLSQIIFPKISKINKKQLSLENIGILMYFNDKFYLKNLIEFPTKEEVNNIYNEKYKIIKKNIFKTNIILIQSDYFWYPKNLFKKYEINLKEIAPNLYQFLKEGQYADIDISSLDKSDLNGEYEALTGLPVELFPHFEQVRGNLFLEPLMSIASVLNANGYKSYVVLNCDKKNNNRNKFYKILGFDQIIDIKDFKNKFSDLSNNDKNISIINDILNNNQEIKGKFIFSKINAIKKHYLNIDEAQNFKQYIDDIKALDLTFSKLFENVKKTNQPIVFIFYNIRLPKIGINSKKYNFSGFIDKINDDEKQNKLVMGKMFIWDNYSNFYKNILNKKKKYLGYIDLIFIPELILNHGSFNKPFYYDYLNKLRTEKRINIYSDDYVMKENKIFLKTHEFYKSITKELKIINNDLLSGQYFIEKSNKCWVSDRK